MHDTKMSQAEMNSTGKINIESTDKSLVVTIITVFWVIGYCPVNIIIIQPLCYCIHYDSYTTN